MRHRRAMECSCWPSPPPHTMQYLDYFDGRAPSAQEIVVLMRRFSVAIGGGRVSRCFHS